jgi:hypothetical protein
LNLILSNQCEEAAPLGELFLFFWRVSLKPPKVIIERFYANIRKVIKKFINFFNNFFY